MARVGRPRTKVDRQEMFGAFARMTASEREYALDVMTTVHASLTPEDSSDTPPKSGETIEFPSAKSSVS